MIPGYLIGAVFELVSDFLGPMVGALMVGFAVVVDGEMYLTRAGERYLGGLEPGAAV